LLVSFFVDLIFLLLFWLLDSSREWLDYQKKEC
jgi:hypothetical protein